MSEPSVSVESETTYRVRVTSGGQSAAFAEADVRDHSVVWQYGPDGMLHYFDHDRRDDGDRSLWRVIGTLVEEPPGSHNWALQVPVDESLEAEARAMVGVFAERHGYRTWDGCRPETRDTWLDAARAARAVREGK